MDYYRKRLSEYGDSLKADTKEMSNLDRIVLKRIWSAWGEGASLFGWNLVTFAEDLPELAKKAVESKGEEKEAAKKELEEYLANHYWTITSEWGGRFQDGFLGSKVKGAIVWNQLADSIEEFAQKVVSKDLPNYDYAEEITNIDLQKKKVVSQSAEYILRGHS